MKIVLALQSFTLKIVFVIANLQPENGGLSRSVPALCEALAKAGTMVEILSLDYGAVEKAAL